METKSRSTASAHQSGPRRSPAAGVTAAHQVVVLILPLTLRTLPSAIPTWIPPVCGVEAWKRSHCAGVGVSWKLTVGPLLIQVSNAGIQL